MRRAALVLIVLGLLCLAWAVPVAVLAHDIYSEWTQPDNGVSCCHDEDCRPTRAYRDEDGQWHAWDGKRWVAIPPNKLLPTDKAGDGRNHLCERWGTVYCFSPTSPRI